MTDTAPPVARPEYDRAVRLREACRILGLSRSSVLRIPTDRLRPIEIIKGIRAYLLSDLLAYLDSRPVAVPDPTRVAAAVASPRHGSLAYDKPLCASLDGFTLHAATRAGGLDAEGREALLRYVLRPPIAQERVEPRPDGLVRITLKKAYADGTVAVDMDPLSLLCRLATSVPLPRFHTIHYAGVLAAASPWRSRLKPSLPPTAEDIEPEKMVRKSGYRPWAELLERTFAVNVLRCPSCQGRMRLLAVVKNPAGIARYLAAVGELTEVPGRSPPRAPPYWKSQVLRRQALGDQGGGGDHHHTDHEAA